MVYAPPICPSNLPVFFVYKHSSAPLRDAVPNQESRLPVDIFATRRGPHSIQHFRYADRCLYKAIGEDKRGIKVLFNGFSLATDHTIFQILCGLIFVRSSIYLNSQIHQERIDVEIETTTSLLQLGLGV